MLELTEESVKEFIKDGTVVIKGWMDGCSKCEEFTPVFEKVSKQLAGVKFGSLKISRDSSEFKRTYMKAKPGEPMGAPCTFIFENGEYKIRQHGKMSEEELVRFIKTLEPIAEKEKTIAELSLIELKALVYDKMAVLELMQKQILELNQEIQKRS